MKINHCCRLLTGARDGDKLAGRGQLWPTARPASQPASPCPKERPSEILIFLQTQRAGQRWAKVCLEWARAAWRWKAAEKQETTSRERTTTIARLCCCAHSHRPRARATGSAHLRSAQCACAGAHLAAGRLTRARSWPPLNP